MVEEPQKKPTTPAWQSDRSEQWAFGKKEANPREATGGRSFEERERDAAQQVEPQMEFPDDTPEMAEKRKKMRRPEGGQSLVGVDPSDGFQME